MEELIFSMPNYSYGRNNQKDNAGRAMSTLKKEYTLIGKHHIKGWHIMLIIGVMVGIVAGVVLVSGRSGKVESGKAEAPPPVVISNIPLTDGNLYRGGAVILGNWAAWYQQRPKPTAVNADVIAYNLSAQTSQTIWSLGQQHSPALSQDLLAFVLNEKKIALYNLDTQKVAHGINGDNAGNPAVFGQWLAWEDVNKKDHQRDIRVKNLITQQELNLSTLTGRPAYTNDANPVIAGNYLVWDRAPTTGSTDWSIYLYDLVSGTAQQITPPGESHITRDNPSISGNLVVWEESVDHSTKLYISMYDISAKVMSRVTNDPDATQRSPVISGDRIVWQDYRNGVNNIW